MKRREFISLLGGALLTAPGALLAQPGRTPRVGILSGLALDDEEMKQRVRGVRDGLRKLGWIDGRNVEIVVRAAGGSEQLQAAAAELIALQPNVIVAAATTALAALRKSETRIPIVFAQVTDPVGAGLVQSLARPGGNITGFTQHEFSIALKWIELLRELAPGLTRAAILYDPHNPASAGYLELLKSNANPFDIQLHEQPVRTDADAERGIAAVANRPHGGLIVLPGPGPSVRREMVVRLAAQHRLPAVYPFRYWVTAGGLAFYGVDNIDLYRLAASYVDKILKGEKPAELPVQHSTKFELIINLKTAKVLGIEPPISLLARTDEVIE